MKANNASKILAVFAIAVLLVAGVTAGAGTILANGGQTTTQPDAPAYDTDALLPSEISDEGSVASPDASTEKTIVVDTSHGNAISRAAMQPLVNALVRAGHEVRFFSGGSSTSFASSSSSGLNKTLSNADALVIANPATSYSGGEVDGIEAFEDAGGRVLLLADTPTQATSATSLLGLSTGSTGAGSGQPNEVASRFGITFGSSYLYNMEENANNFQYIYGSASDENDVAAGATKTVFQAAVPVVTSDDTTTAITGQNVSLSSTREKGTHAVAVRNENVIAVGDTWFLSSDGATLEDNEKFVGNIASFLVTGTKTSGAPQSSSASATLGPTIPTTGQTTTTSNTTS